MLKLNDREWKSFPISAIASISPGKRLTKADMLPGKTPFIGASDSCNGITEFISNKNESEDRNVLGVNYNGSVVENFYHPYRALFSDDVKRLHLLGHEGNQYIYLFLKAVILKQKSKYQYAYKFNEERLKRQKILLPIANSGEPDYEFMEQYSKNLMENKRAKYIERFRKELAKIEFKEIEKIDDVKWHEFFLKDILPSIQRGKRLTKENQTSGKNPYISSTGLNNGVDNFIGNYEGVRSFSNCLTIANSGSVGSSFYHPYSFVASDHVTHMKNNEFSSFVYLFILTQANKLSSKYNFNREINDMRIEKEKILLPITNNGEPDYPYMEQYMMNIEYMKRMQYLDHMESQKNQ